MTARRVLVHVVVAHSAVSSPQDHELLNLFKSLHLSSTMHITTCQRCTYGDYGLGEWVSQKQAGVVQHFADG